MLDKKELTEQIFSISKRMMEDNRIISYSINQFPAETINSIEGSQILRFTHSIKVDYLLPTGRGGFEYSSDDFNSYQDNIYKFLIWLQLQWTEV